MRITVEAVTKDIRPIKGGQFKGQQSIGLKAGDKWYNVLYSGQKDELKGAQVELAEKEGGQYPVYAIEGTPTPAARPQGGGYRGGGRPAPVAQGWEGMERCASAAVDLARGFWKEDTEAQRTFVNTVVMAYCRGELKPPGAVTDEEVGPEWGERRDTEGVPF